MASEPVGRFAGIDLGISCVVASSPAGERNVITVDTNDMSGRSTPAAISYDGKRRLVGSSAEGRLLAAPKQTITHLPLTLGAADLTQRRGERYLWQFPIQEDGNLGPFTFDGEAYSTAPCGPLGAALRVLASYADKSSPPQALGLAVADYLDEAEVAVVRDALDVAGLSPMTALLRHSDAVAIAFAHGARKEFFQPDGNAGERIVAFVDIGVSHGTVSVVNYSRPVGSPTSEATSSSIEPIAEFLYRRTDEAIGVQSLIEALVGEATKQIEEQHKCKVRMRSKAGWRLTNEAVQVMRTLSMLPEAQLALDSFMPEGPEGPEIDVKIKVTRQMFETAAAGTLQKISEMLGDMRRILGETGIEGIELIGGGIRVPAVQKLIREAVGEAPIRFGLDGDSSIAMGAAAWASGWRLGIPALTSQPFPGPGALAPEALERVRHAEAKIEAINSAELERLEARNALESYVYQVKDWLSGKDGKLLNPEALYPHLDKILLWLEDADSEEPTPTETFASKLSETETLVNSEGRAYFEKRAQAREEEEKALQKAGEEELQRQKDAGEDEKADRVLPKATHFRLATKNKEEGNELFQAQNFADAIRRYKKAVEHVSRPEMKSSLSPDEVDIAKKLKISCHLNSAQCYLKAADKAAEMDGKNAAVPYFKKAKVSCEDVLEIDKGNLKARFRRSACWEKLGDLEQAMGDIKLGLDENPEDDDLKRASERLQKMLSVQKEGEKKMFSKMFR